MKRFLFLAALLLPLSLFGAPGDISAVNVEANGWVLAMTFEGATNGTFASFGFGTNNSITGNEKVKLMVTSPGYDTAGNSTTIKRTLYGTKQLRLPYPQASVNDVVTNAEAGTCTIRMALSDWVCASDTATFTVGAGLYTAQTVPNNAASGTCTINSTTVYPKTIGKWTWPNWDKITGNSYKLRCVVFNHFAQQGAQVACVVFQAVEGAHTNTVTVTKPIIDRTIGDAVPFYEYVATMDASTFTQGNVVTNYFFAYPWVGDAGSVLNAGDGVNPATKPYYYPLYYLCDRLGTYSPTIAVVNQATGEVHAVVSKDGSMPSTAFASINQAAYAIAATNNAVNGHNDSGGGTIYLQGTNSFTGTTASAATTRGLTWLTLSNYPGDTTAAVVDGTGPGGVNSLTKLAGLHVRADAAAAFMFSAVSNLWFDSCTFDVTNSSKDMIDGAGFHYATRCQVTNFDQGFLQQGSQNTVFPLVRGCYFWSNFPGVQPYGVVGNFVDATNYSVFTGTGLTGLPQAPQEVVIYANKFLQAYYYGNTFLSFYGQSVFCTNGAVFACNLLESVNTNNGDGLLLIHGDGNSSDVTNLMVFGNTAVGAKVNFCYNDTGSTARWSWLCGFKNNIWGDPNIKSDTFTTANGARVGNWPMLYGVGCSGEAMLEYSPGAPGSFLREFAGINCYQPTINAGSQPPTCVANDATFTRFVDDESCSVANQKPNPLGNGNYRLKTSSPLSIISTETLLPGDGEGNASSQLGPPGFYGSASPRKGGGFFGQ